MPSIGRFAALPDPVDAVVLARKTFATEEQMGQDKASAVHAMWDGTTTDDVPASLLRMHPRLAVYLASDSAVHLSHPPALG